MTTQSNSLKQPQESPTPDVGTLWWAYAISPAVAPTVFAITMFVGGLIWHRVNPDTTGTPIGIILLPIISLTVGIAASYFVAGVIGMPLAFSLRKRGLLNGYTIHGAALIFTFLFIGAPSVIAYAMAPPTRPPLTDFLISTLTMTAVMAPFILLSATTFWWIVSRGLRGLSLRSLLLIVTVVAVLAAILAAFLR